MLKILKEQSRDCKANTFIWDVSYNNFHYVMDECIQLLEQEPGKGHWILVQRGKCIDICCSKCEAVRIKEFAYNYTIDQLDKEDVKECLESDDMRYCPYCGSDNREVEE